MADASDLHVVMFPFFAFGHISPFVQLSNKLSSHGVKISFLSARGNVDRIKSMLTPSPKTEVISLTVPEVDGLSKGLESTAELSPAEAELLKVAMDLMQPQIKTLLAEMKPHFVLFDFAQDWLPQLASQLGIKSILYSVFMALSTAFLMDKKSSPTLDEAKEPPVGFPQTCVSRLRTFEGLDFLYVFKSFNGESTVYDRLLKGITTCDAILIKTCKEMEGPYIEFIKKHVGKPILLAGPVVPEPQSSQVLEERWAKWLDQFPSQSVIYCSFGSETFLNQDQINQLLQGLELTGLPVLVVLNFPANMDASTELKASLPDGFLEKFKNRGIIHTGWVQQQQILAHPSVGCFVCHAGFSSVIEALINDCQLVMLPLKSDQFMNSKLVAGDLKAGVEVNRRDEDGYFGKDDIKKAVDMVMVDVDQDPGKSIRQNQKKWKDFLHNKNVQEKFAEDLVKDIVKILQI